MSFLYRARVQVNDVFSQFGRFISPMYYHDRCERTLQMYVYVMHKREVLLSLSALLSTYVLLLFIGLAGPNVDRINGILATEMIASSNISPNYTGRLLSSGPFLLTTPRLSAYSQQLSLYISFTLKNEESSEAFHKDFDVIIDLDGIGSAGYNQTLVSHGRFESSLYCGGRKCDPIRVMRLIRIEFQHYRVNITFDRLRSVNEKYTINDILFEFRSVNVSFTTLSIWFRFFFLMITFLVTCFYMHHLYRFPIIDWSLEQKWTAAQLILLILSNNPFYPIQFLLGWQFPFLMEVWLHTTLQTLIMLFWLCFFHGIRQNNRSLSKFYAPKLTVIGIIWICVIYTMSWSLRNQMDNPIFDEISVYNHSVLLQLLNVAFYLSFVCYFFYLFILSLAAFTELRSMPYFDVRLKLQTFLMLFVLTISMLTILISTSSNPMASSNMISSVPFLQLLPFTHFSSSSATFLSIFSLANIYICACAYYYRPSLNQTNECHIVRDNPTLSMIDDSDEEVLYGSDTEELLSIQQQTVLDHNNHHHHNHHQSSGTGVTNLIDTRTDEESD